MLALRHLSILKMPFRCARHRPRHRPHIVSVIAGALAVLLAWSVAYAAPDVTATNARIRLLPGDLPLAGYFDLLNRGSGPLTLIAASSPAFKKVHMHLSTEQGGKSTMINIEGIEMNPGETLHFAPGGYHLMLMQRVQPLQVGDKVPVTLRFSGDQSIQVMFAVKNAVTR